MAAGLMAMLSVFGGFLLLFAVFTGIGLGLRRLFGLRKLDTDACLLAFWHGFGVVLLFLLLWNFLLPVNVGAQLVVLLAGLVAVAPALRKLASRGRPVVSTRAVVLVTGLWIAHLSTGSFTSWDGGLYHLQAVQWASRYPVVSGIANLHGPLAFNNSSFLYAALLDSGLWQGRAFPWRPAAAGVAPVVVPADRRAHRKSGRRADTAQTARRCTASARGKSTAAVPMPEMW